MCTLKSFLRLQNQFFSLNENNLTWFILTISVLTLTYVRFLFVWNLRTTTFRPQYLEETSWLPKIAQPFLNQTNWFGFLNGCWILPENSTTWQCLTIQKITTLILLDPIIVQKYLLVIKRHLIVLQPKLRYFSFSDETLKRAG